MPYLIIRIAKERNGADAHALFSVRHPLGEPGFAEVSAAAREYGYEVAPAIISGGRDRERWPMRAIAYTSRSKHGVGRSGSSVQCWLAAPLPQAWVPRQTSYAGIYTHEKWTCAHQESGGVCHRYHRTEVLAVEHCLKLNRIKWRAEARTKGSDTRTG